MHTPISPFVPRPELMHASSDALDELRPRPQGCVPSAKWTPSCISPSRPIFVRATTGHRTRGCSSSIHCRTTAPPLTRSVFLPAAPLALNPPCFPPSMLAASSLNVARAAPPNAKALQTPFFHVSAERYRASTRAAPPVARPSSFVLRAAPSHTSALLMCWSCLFERKSL